MMAGVSFFLGWMVEYSQVCFRGGYLLLRFTQVSKYFFIIRQSRIYWLVIPSITSLRRSLHLFKKYLPDERKRWAGKLY